MRTVVFVAALLLLISWVWAGGVAAVEISEVGIRLHVSHDPHLSQAGLSAVVSLGGYCRIAVADGWAIRAELGSPLSLFLPQLGIASTHDLGERLSIEAQLWLQSDFMGSALLSLNAGARVRLVGSEASRLTVASFPVSLLGFFGWSGNVSFFSATSLNAYLDYTWLASDNLVLGETIGLTAVRLSPDVETALPLLEMYGLRVGSTTRAGIRW